MTVTINKSDGTVLTTIADGAIDTSSTNLALIGRLYRNYGELVNENLVHLLENFASTATPTTPILGQLWYNKTTKAIQLYRDTGFVPLARISSSTAEPSNPSIADLWWDLTDEQLRMYNGSTWITIAPVYNASQGKTGAFAETIVDTTSANHIAVLIYQQGQPITIFSRDPQYTPQAAITGFSSIKTGINLSSISGFELQGSATNADLLDNIDSTQFVRSDVNDEIDGTIWFNNNGGFSVGTSHDVSLTVSGSHGVITKATGDLHVVMGSSLAVVINSDQQLQVPKGSEAVPSITSQSDASTGIYFNADGQFDITVSGSTAIGVDVTQTEVFGDLRVDGAATVLGVFRAESDVYLGSVPTDILTVNADTMSIPNGLTISGGQLTISGTLHATGGIVLNGTTMNGDFVVNGTTALNGAVTVTAHSANDLKIDSLGRVMVGVSAPATGYLNAGDVTLGATNGIYARNVAKYVVSFNGTLASLAILESHHVATVTRLSAGNYTITLKDDSLVDVPLISGNPTVVGSTGTAGGIVYKNGTSAPGDTSMNISTNGDSALVSVVIYDGAN